MKIPSVTRCDIKIVQFGILADTVLCDIYFNDVLLYKGIQNKNFPIPFGTYKATPYKGSHAHERLLLLNVNHHSGVEIHEANRAIQLRGCTAIGFFLNGEFLSDSVRALESLIKKIKLYNVCYVTLSCSITGAEYTAVL